MASRAVSPWLAAAFKGFPATLRMTRRSAGISWSTPAGGGSTPPAQVPQFMAVTASNSITMSGSQISGDAPEVVVVKTNPGYGPDPSQPGTGTVVGIVCGG